MKHNDPMADIALVGPGGRDKLKKLIKSLQDSAKEGEDAEYVIAQALNDLNDRIATLEQSQSNWNESDNTKPDYIKNKPYVLPIVNFNFGNVLLKLVSESEFNTLSKTPLLNASFGDANAVGIRSYIDADIATAIGDFLTDNSLSLVQICCIWIVQYTTDDAGVNDGCTIIALVSCSDENNYMAYYEV